MNAFTIYFIILLYAHFIRFLYFLLLHYYRCLPFPPLCLLPLNPISCPTFYTWMDCFKEELNAHYRNMEGGLNACPKSIFIHFCLLWIHQLLTELSSGYFFLLFLINTLLGYSFLKLIQSLITICGWFIVFA